MRNFMIVALTLLGAAWVAGDAQAQNWRRGGNTYIYPEGTQGYFVGPQGRSNYYVIPSVSNGDVSQWYNNPPSFYSTQNRDYYYNNANDNSNGGYQYQYQYPRYQFRRFYYDR